VLNHTRREAGFTLIEILIAVVVMAIVLTSVAMATTSSASRSVKAGARVQAAAALEQAVERVNGERPWRDAGSVACPGTINQCAYTFVTKVTEGRKFNAQVTVTKVGDVGYTVTVVMTVTDLANVPIPDVDPISTTYVVDRTGVDVTGEIVLTSCYVSQVDERMAPGSCELNGGTSVRRQMEPPHVSTTIPSPLLPPVLSFFSNPAWLQWENAVAAGRADVVMRSTTYWATVWKPGSPTPVAQTGGPHTGTWTVPNLPKGDYILDVQEVTAAGNPFSTADFDLWANKSIGYRYWTNGVVDKYSVHVSPGAQSRVTRLWEPKPVDVNLGIITGDASIPWNPRVDQNSAEISSSSYANRVMLQPFPQGRAVIPGVGRSRAACSTNAYAWDADNHICRDDWGYVGDGTGNTILRQIRPGLYSSSAYRSYRVTNGTDPDTWVMKNRPIVRRGLGIGTDNEYDDLANETARADYIYVKRNGAIETFANPSVPATDRSVAVSFPHCQTGKRTDLRLLTQQKPGKWIMQRDSGAIMPSTWTPSNVDGIMNPGRIPSYNDNSQAYGWVKFLGKTWQPPANGIDGMWVSTYNVAQGTWAQQQPGTTGYAFPHPLNSNRWIPGSTLETFTVSDSCYSFEVDVNGGGDGTT
jgi:prepilin-type N-terminal cleavage/methylation domain-containing protein